MRPSFGVDFVIDRSDFTAARGAFFMGVLGSDLIPGSRLAGRAFLMGPLGSDLIPGSRFTAGSRFMAGSFLTGGQAGTAPAVSAVFFSAGVLVDFRAVCFGLGAGLADGSSCAGPVAAATAPVDFRAVCLLFGTGLASIDSVFTFWGIVLAFLGSGVEGS